MTDILNRVELHTPEQARAVLTTSTLPWIGEQLKQGRELVLEVRLLEDDITDKQRGFLHAVVLTEIAQGLVIDGRRYSMAVWKEHLRREFLPDKVQTFINPLTGRKSRRRVRQSTEDLGIRGMADYIDKCCAWAAEHGITISAPLPPELRPSESGPRPSRTANLTPIRARFWSQRDRVQLPAHRHTSPASCCPGDQRVEDHTGPTDLHGPADAHPSGGLF